MRKYSSKGWSLTRWSLKENAACKLVVAEMALFIDLNEQLIESQVEAMILSFSRVWIPPNETALYYKAVDFFICFRDYEIHV